MKFPEKSLHHATLVKVFSLLTKNCAQFFIYIVKNFSFNVIFSLLLCAFLLGHYEYLMYVKVLDAAETNKLLSESNLTLTTELFQKHELLKAMVSYLEQESAKEVDGDASNLDISTLFTLFVSIKIILYNKSSLLFFLLFPFSNG